MKREMLFIHHEYHGGFCRHVFKKQGGKKRDLMILFQENQQGEYEMYSAVDDDWGEPESEIELLVDSVEFSMPDGCVSDKHREMIQRCIDSKRSESYRSRT